MTPLDGLIRAYEAEPCCTVHMDPLLAKCPATHPISSICPVTPSRKPAGTVYAFNGGSAMNVSLPIAPVRARSSTARVLRACERFVNLHPLVCPNPTGRSAVRPGCEESSPNPAARSRTSLTCIRPKRCPVENNGPANQLASLTTSLRLGNRELDAFLARRIRSCVIRPQRSARRV